MADVTLHEVLDESRAFYNSENAFFEQPIKISFVVDKETADNRLVSATNCWRKHLRWLYNGMTKADAKIKRISRSISNKLSEDNYIIFDEDWINDLEQRIKKSLRSDEMLIAFALYPIHKEYRKLNRAMGILTNDALACENTFLDRIFNGQYHLLRTTITLFLVEQKNHDNIGRKVNSGRNILAQLENIPKTDDPRVEELERCIRSSYNSFMKIKKTSHESMEKISKEYNRILNEEQHSEFSDGE